MNAFDRSEKVFKGRGQLTIIKFKHKYMLSKVATLILVKHILCVLVLNVLVEGGGISKIEYTLYTKKIDHLFKY